MLNNQQLTIFKAALFAETDATLVGYRTNGQTGLIRDWYNTADPANFAVWKQTTPVQDIQDAITWANYTPANPSAAADTLTAMNTIAQQNACQGKQFNLQMLLTANSFNASVATGKANVRAGIQDATSQIPSDTDMAVKTGGWVTIKAIIQRPATRIEKLFATGTGTTTNPGDIVVTGLIEQDVTTALNS